MSANISRDTATSAIWKVAQRPCLRISASTLIRFSRRLVSDHGCARLGHLVPLPKGLYRRELPSQKRLEQHSETGPQTVVRLLTRIIGVGVETADLPVHEVLSRPLCDRRTDKSLCQLDTSYVDVYQLHGVPPNAYDHALNELAPVLLREKEKGKLRYLGITETAPHDPEHQMLHRAAQDGVWDVVMVGFHMMHQNARETGSGWPRPDERGSSRICPLPQR